MSNVNLRHLKSTTKLVEYRSTPSKTTNTSKQIKNPNWQEVHFRPMSYYHSQGVDFRTTSPSAREVVWLTYGEQTKLV